jgi:hypothetical protein
MIKAVPVHARQRVSAQAGVDAGALAVRRSTYEGDMRPFRVVLAGFVVFGLVIAVSVIAFSPAIGGTICGIVRDAQTGVPVPQAGVFVRVPDGSYTGFYGATDLTGHFCIAEVPAGTYDLEVLVDNYRVACLRNVVVTSSTDVMVPATLSRVQLVPPRPSPAAKETDLHWVLPRPASTFLMVVDALGRVVQEWSLPLLPAGEHAIRWDLRGADGRTVPAGCYFVVLDADGARRVRSFRKVS